MSCGYADNNKSTWICFRDHVSVSDSGHGGNSPPEAIDDAFEVVLFVSSPVGLDALREVAHGGEYHNAENEEKYEQQQLPRTTVQGM